MPMRWLAWAAVLTGLAGSAALAQAPAPSADDEAMARARRQAENPLKRILEASRITVRRRAATDAGAATDAERRGVTGPGSVAAADGATGPLPAATDEASAIRITVEPILPAPPSRPPAAEGPALALPPGWLPGAAPAAGLPALAPSVSPAPEPLASEPPGPSVAASAARPDVTPPTSVPPPPVPPVATSRPATPTVEAAVAAESAPARQPADPPDGAPSDLPPRPSALPVAEPSPPAAAEPALRNLVEPVLTPRLRDELGLAGTVTVDLQLGSDGRVQDVVFLSRVPVAVRRVVASALLQWQYAPLPEPTLHRVELVFER